MEIGDGLLPETVRFYDDNNSIALDPNSGDTIEVSFDADGVRVGDVYSNSARI